MGQSRKAECVCPYCGRHFEIDVWDSVNAASDPHERERVMSGDLFRHSCPHCKTDFMFQNDLVYLDPRFRFMIWLSEKDPLDQLVQYTRPLAQQGWKLRRCNTIPEMIEKIQIFEDRMDDVAVELAKYDSFIEFIDNKKGRPEDVTSVEYQRTDNGVMKINIRMDDKGMSFLIPTGMIEEELEENPERYAVNNEEIPCINSDWMISLFTESEGKA